VTRFVCTINHGGGGKNSQKCEISLGSAAKETSKKIDSQRARRTTLYASGRKSTDERMNGDDALDSFNADDALALNWNAIAHTSKKHRKLDLKYGNYFYCFWGHNGQDI